MNRTLSSCLFSALLCLASPKAEGADASIIRVQVSGCLSDQGEVLLALYDDADAFPSQPERAVAFARGKIQGKKAEASFPAVAPGSYAIAAFQDENLNGKLDTNFLGIPKEAVGASNNPKKRLGAPAFKEAAFQVKEEDVSLQVVLKKY